MAYLKGNHCNNNCKHFFGENETVYNRNHGGDPGSTDYEEYRMYCCANSEEGIQLLHVVYNCPIYQAVEHGVQSDGWVCPACGSHNQTSYVACWYCSIPPTRR